MSNGGNGANAAEPGPQVSSGRNGRLNVGATVGLIVPLGAVVAALAVGAIMLLALGANPLDGYRAMFSGAVGGTDNVADTAIKAMPLLLVGVGICVAFRAGVINIGGEGQIIAGAIVA